MSESIQTGWGNGHMYRLTRDIYIYSTDMELFFFYTFVFMLLMLYTVDTAHMT